MIFRRIHGHIVPISDMNARQRKDLKHGAADVTAAAAVAAVTGKATAEMVRKHDRMFKASRAEYKSAQEHLRGQLNMFNAPNAATQVRKAVNKRAFAAKLFRSRSAILKYGIAATGVLLGEGVRRIHNAFKKDSKTNTLALPDRAIGGAAAALVLGSYYKALPVKGAAKIASNVAARFKGAPRPHQAEWFK